MVELNFIDLKMTMMMVCFGLRSFRDQIIVINLNKSGFMESFCLLQVLKTKAAERQQNPTKPQQKVLKRRSRSQVVLLSDGRP